MACEYIYKGTTYSSKEEFISKVIPTLQNSTLSKFDKVPTNKQVYLSSIKNYEDNIVNFEKAIQAIKDNNYKIILPNNAGRYVASVESEGIRGGTIPIAENPYNKEAKEGKFDKEYALSYLKGRIEIEKGSIENENRKIKEIEKVENDVYNKNISSNQFLQLLNKDNNWVLFFIRSIIQDSIKNGYEKILFPSGDTASKVEGHTTLEEFKKQKEDRIKELEKQLEKPEYVVDWLDTSGYSGQNIVFKTEQEALDYVKTENAKLPEDVEGGYTSLFNGERLNREINQLKQELERVDREGFGALAPIHKFYESTVGNTLKKQYKVNKVTDEYGNSWNEINLITLDDTPVSKNHKVDKTFSPIQLSTTLKKQYIINRDNDIEQEDNLKHIFENNNVYLQYAYGDVAIYFTEQDRTFNDGKLSIPELLTQLKKDKDILEQNKNNIFFSNAIQINKNDINNCK